MTTARLPGPFKFGPRRGRRRSRARGRRAGRPVSGLGVDVVRRSQQTGDSEPDCPSGPGRAGARSGECEADDSVRPRQSESGRGRRPQAIR